MPRNHLLRQSTIGAISLPRFAECFQHSYSDARFKDLSRAIPRRLGLAVSGGPDSMALAYLCKQLEKSKLMGDLSFTAFVVDHKAREESGREARTVSGWLNDLDIKSQILELDWAEIPTGFETRARESRYRVIGNACKDLGIEAILMGHHQDDSVETTLKRLIHGSRGTGLAGIWQSAVLPECHGLYGLSESGSSFKLRRSNELAARFPRLRVNIPPRQIEIESRKTPPATLPEPRISTGGIVIYRPFLSFSKAHLLATCEENNVPFVTDPTNLDPTVTERNTIRHVLATDQLPRALRAPSILSVMNNRRDYMDERAIRSDKLLEKCEVLDVNLNVGSIVIRFPSSNERLHPEPNHPSSTPETTESRAHHFHGSQAIEAFTLRRITDLVSPRKRSATSLEKFVPTTERLFFPANPPEPPTSLQNEQKNQYSSFIVNCVLFMPLRWKKENTAAASPAGLRLLHGKRPNPPPTVRADNPPDPPDHDNVFIMARQPFMRHPYPPIPLPFNISIPPSSPGNPQTHYSAWQLWDNRFWIRINVTPVETQHPSSSSSSSSSSSPPSPDPEVNTDVNKADRPLRVSTPTITLKVRPFQKNYVRQAQALLSRRKRQGQVTSPGSEGFFIRRMKRMAPGFILYTLPLITLDNCGEETPVGLPTVGDRFSPEEYDFEWDSRRWRVGWEWMYKKIEVDALQSMGWVDKD